MGDFLNEKETYELTEALPMNEQTRQKGVDVDIKEKAFSWM